MREPLSVTHDAPLTADVQPDALPVGFPLAELEPITQELQDKLVALVPNARHVVAKQSGHYIQLQQPGLVITAIRQVVEAVRDPASWATPVASPAASPQT